MWHNSHVFSLTFISLNVMDLSFSLFFGQKLVDYTSKRFLLMPFLNMHSNPLVNSVITGKRRAFANIHFAVTENNPMKREHRTCGCGGVMVWDLGNQRIPQTTLIIKAFILVMSMCCYFRSYLIVWNSFYFLWIIFMLFVFFFRFLILLFRFLLFFFQF